MATIEEIQNELNRLQGELDKLKQENLYIPQPGEVVEISCDEKNWYVRIFVKYDKNLVNPFVCVNGDIAGNEARYKDGVQYKTTSWGLCRRLNGEIVEFGCDKPQQESKGSFVADSVKADEAHDKLKYLHLLPDGYEFCDEGQAEKWVKVELNPQEGNSQEKLGGIWHIAMNNEWKPFYRPIRKIQAEPDSYEVDWSNAPEWADSHAFDGDRKGYWYGADALSGMWCKEVKKSPFTLPSGLDWKQSKTLRPR